MSDPLGQQVLVENRPGAGTSIGASEVARSTPDGYTLLLGDAGTYAFNPTLYKRLSYDPVKDFAPVSLTGRFALILAVNSSMPAKSLKEFVDAAKRQPGKIDYGAPGPGSPIHLAMEFFKQRAGLVMTPIPYKGGADAMNDLIGGRIPAMFLDIASGLPQIRGGKVRALAVASDKRVAALPDLPTIGESGYPGFEAWAWQGFVAPAGTPRAVVDKLNAEFAKVMADPAIKQRLSESGFEPQTSTPEQFAAYLKSEIAKWQKVIRDSNISLD
jgi:tripartite-type tricarboxylate transporter receptor subunit TctC